MKPLKQIPFFLLLLVLFFCLHGSLENYGFIELNEVLMIGIVLLICISLLFGLLFWILRNYILASLITFFISFWYIFFGAFHDWMKNLTSHSFFSSYSFLIPLLLVLTGLLIVSLKRNTTLSQKLVLYLNVLLLIYCLVDGVLIVFKYFAPQEIKINAIAFDYKKVKAKPNVYFLLFDEYPGYKSLKDSFGFRNDKFYEYMQSKNFQKISTVANYDMTVYSMSSMLNMNYVPNDFNKLGITQNDLQVRIDEIKRAEVFRIFKKMEYQIENFSPFDIGDIKGAAIKNEFFPIHEVLITDKILHNRVLNTFKWFFASSPWSPNFIKKKILYANKENNQYSIEKVKGNIDIIKNNSVFSYVHLVMPHWPFYNDSTGNLVNENIIANDLNLSNKTLFLSYLKYTNQIIENIVDKITSKDPLAVIIIMSDHGYRSFKGNNKNEQLNFDNICFVRGLMFKDSTEIPIFSNVNIFRYVFNKNFGQRFPLLNDSSTHLFLYGQN